MATTRGLLSLHSCSERACSGFQCHESRILHPDFPRLTYGLPSCGLTSVKQRLNTVTDSRYLQKGSKKCLLDNRRPDIFRTAKSVPVVVAHNSHEKDTASASTDSNNSDRSSKSEKCPTSVDHELKSRNSLHSLDSYFSKLQGGDVSSKALVNAVASAMLPLLGQHRIVLGQDSAGTPASQDEGKELNGLESLDAYFEKLHPKKPEPEPIQQIVQSAIDKDAQLTDEDILIKSLMEVKEEYERQEISRSFVRDKQSSQSHDVQFQVTSRNNEMDLTNWDLQPDHTNSNLINILVATNIAVYLFGLASPHEAFGITDSSVPFVYGAKVNDLILEGQWWRLLTPMFLHASLLHVGLGSWALLSFGPAVESAYGPLGFAMIYFLGGLFGDLSSFFHTSEWTVGGTGPIYALVGTWVVYLLRNREIIGKDIADDMIRKVVILSALNVALCNSLPIDDWTHLGAVGIGTLFGFLASPTMQLNVAVKDSSSEEQEKDASSYFWFNDGASPVRLGLIFALCLGIFFILYQLSVSGSNDLFLPEDDLFS